MFDIRRAPTPPTKMSMLRCRRHASPPRYVASVVFADYFTARAVRRRYTDVA